MVSEVELDFSLFLRRENLLPQVEEHELSVAELDSHEVSFALLHDLEALDNIKIRVRRFFNVFFGVGIIISPVSD
jgi:hypothetical protein